MKQYYVRLICNKEPNKNEVSYLSHKSRTTWGKRTAKKHAEEFIAKHGQHTYQLEEA